jgi:hypothetical protein
VVSGDSRSAQTKLSDDLLYGLCCSVVEYSNWYKGHSRHNLGNGASLSVRGYLQSTHHMYKADKTLKLGDINIDRQFLL